MSPATGRSGIGFGRGNGTLGGSPSQSQLYTKVDIFKEA